MLNIDSNTLNCILLGIIIAIVAILFFKIMKRKNLMQENMHVKENDPKALNKFDAINNATAECDSENTQSTVTDSNSSSTNSSQTEPKKEKQKEKKKEEQPTKYCDLNEMEDMDHRLIRDVVVGKKYQQGDKQEIFGREEIDNYFLQYQDFDDKINYSSRNRCDMVEKLAQDRTHNTELVNKQGLTIGDVFDGLTRDQIEKMKQCKNPNCIEPSKYDVLTQRQYYFDREDTHGATYSNYNTRYETDEVNNGGKFYDDIEAHDETLMQAMAYKN
jgi:hypothetical protein